MPSPIEVRTAINNASALTDPIFREGQRAQISKDKVALEEALAKARAAKIDLIIQIGLLGTVGNAALGSTNHQLDQLIAKLNDLLIEISDSAESTYNLTWLRETISEIESNERFVSDAAEILTAAPDLGRPSALNFPSLRRLITERANASEKDGLLAELEARIYLHDAFINMVVSKFDIKSINEGYVGLKPTHFETLLHNMSGVRELVGVALGLFEMAIKGKLPPFEGLKAGRFHTTYASQVSEKIGSLLGKNGKIASSIALRLVYATGMLPYYDRDFDANLPMRMRDVMNTEGRRDYYGRRGRGRAGEGVGFRKHGFSNTIGKFFNTADSTNDAGVKINPIVSIVSDGEPKWDLISDFWNFAQITKPDSEVGIIVDGASIIGSESQPRKNAKTLSRWLRHQAGEKPNFDEINSALATDDPTAVIPRASLLELQSLDWSGVVAYEQIHTQSAGQNVIIQESYSLWVKELKNREPLHDLLNEIEWNPAVLSDPKFYRDHKTDFDYLENSANGLRDMRELKGLKISTLQRFQTMFLWAILMDHSPANSAISKDRWWDPTIIITIIYTALGENFINQKQADWLEQQVGVSGFFSKASTRSALKKAIEALGFPGK